MRQQKTALGVIPWHPHRCFQSSWGNPAGPGQSWGLGQRSGAGGLELFLGQHIFLL